MASNGGRGGAVLSFSDRFFSYETFKVLRVRDRRLGGLYRLFQASILIYIATSIIYQQRYLKTENIINGAVRVTLKAPSDGIATPDYCKNTSQPCIYWNENDILYEPGVDGALVTTRAQITQYGPFVNQTSSGGATGTCNVNVPTVPGCDPYTAPSTLLLPTSLVADIERFTLMLEHSIRGQATGVQMRSGNMESGLLRDSASGEVLKTFTDQSRYIASPAANGSTTAVHLAGDVMTMGEFLKASGVNLGDLSAAPTATAGETVRASGVVVIVVIQYAAKGWNPNRISYEYLPKAIPDQEYKVIETIRDFQDSNRVEINRHGIRIVFSQSGQLGQFSLMTLLMNLVAAVALFKVANIIVELMMLRLHPHKKVYVSAKYESTKDVSVNRRGAGPVAGPYSPQPLHLVDTDDTREDMERGPISKMNNAQATQGHLQFPEGKSKRDVTGMTHNGNFPSDKESDCGDFTSASEESEVEGVEALQIRQRISTGAPSETLTGRASGAQLRCAMRRHVRGVEGSDTQCDSFQRTNTTALTHGPSSRSFGDHVSKPTSGLGPVDWNRNGSSSALSADATPGVARVTSRSIANQARRVSSEDIEIETRFGPLRPNESKGFNPGGLVLDDSSSVRPEVVTVNGMMTPKNGGGLSVLADARSSGIIRSTPMMQAVSPVPVELCPPKGKQTESLTATATSRYMSRRHAVSSQGSSSTELAVNIHSSRHSSCSLSSLASSSSSSSLSSSQDGSLFGASDSQILGTSMSLGGNHGLHSSSTWSFGAPESPLGGYSSGADSISGSKSALGLPRIPGASSSSPGGRRGKKKRRKECHPSAFAALPTEQSLSEVLPFRSMFGLGASSNTSSFSLSPSSTGVIDYKGKRPDHSGFTGSTSLQSTTIFDARVMPSQWVMPRCTSDQSEEGRDWKTRISSSSIPCTSSASSLSSVFAKRSRTDSSQRYLRTSASSPSLLRGISTESIKSQPAEGQMSVSAPGEDASTECDSYPAFCSMASVDLPPRSADWRFPNTESMPTSSRSCKDQDRCVSTEGSSSLSSSSIRRSSEPGLGRGSIGHFAPSLPSLPTFASPETTFENLRRAESAADACNGENARRDQLLSLPIGSASHSIAMGSSGHPLGSSVSSGTSMAQYPHHAYTSSASTSTNTIRHANTVLASTTALRCSSTSSIRGAATQTSSSSDNNNNNNHSNYYPHPTSKFFSSPITTSCTGTLAGTGVRVLGRTITMITSDNKKLVLRRSEPLVLNEGVGDEKAARM